MIREATDFLDTRGIEHPRLNAERLLAHVMNTTRIDLYLQFEKPVQIHEREHYKNLLRRRADHEPLQYILGETEFMSIPFQLTHEVLIPRPETELLVEKTIEIAESQFRTKPTIQILDIGTGSGCIAIALAKQLENARILAADSNPAALEVAKKNAGIHNVSDRIEWTKMDVLSQSHNPGTMKFDLIVSNPPYIPEDLLWTLAPEIKNFEPLEALRGGKDGLLFYHQFSRSFPQWINSPGNALLEIGEDQASAIQKIFGNEFWISREIFQDLAGKDRLVVLSH